MAKSPFWLRGARGKFAGAVVYKGSTGTVIREKVTPKNPRSFDQMVTRVAFGTLGTAAKFMLPIIGQTFEGAKDEVANKREFMRMNMPYLRQAANVDTMNYDGIHIANFCPKDIRDLVPNSYVVSKGSLPLHANLSVDPSIEPDEQTSVFVNVPNGDHTAAELWQLLCGLKPTQQLTAVVLTTVNGSDVSFDYNEWIGEGPSGYRIARYTHMYAVRLVLKDGVGDTLAVTDNTNVASIWQCLRSLIDTEKSNSAFVDALENATSYNAQEHKLSWTKFPIVDGADYLPENETTVAFGFIVSQLVSGSWRYSTTRLTCAKAMAVSAAQSAYEDTNFGLQFNDAMWTYKLAQNKASKLFTRQGGLSDSVEG